MGSESPRWKHRCVFMVCGQRDNSLRRCYSCYTDAACVARESRALQMHPACSVFVSGLMNGGSAGLCPQHQLACACVCSGVAIIWGRYTSLWMFFSFFLSASSKLLNRKKKISTEEKLPPKAKCRDGNFGCSSVTFLCTSPDSCSNSV